VVFYELATLVRPFPGELAIDVVRQILDREPIPPATLREDVPADVSDLILEMLAKDPEQRPDDALLAERLGRLALPAS
jgi:serine/threonine-protein kinase